LFKGAQNEIYVTTRLLRIASRLCIRRLTAIPAGFAHARRMTAQARLASWGTKGDPPSGDKPIDLMWRARPMQDKRRPAVVSRRRRESLGGLVDQDRPEPARWAQVSSRRNEGRSTWAGAPGPKTAGWISRITASQAG